MKNRSFPIWGKTLILTLALIALLAACQTAPPPTPQPPATESAPAVSPTARNEELPTATPESSATPIPSPTAASNPTSTITSEATSTDSPETAPTETQPAPTATEAASEPPPTATSQPAASPTATASPESEAEAGSQACRDVAAFYGDLTIPDDTIFYQGERFEKGWRLRNNGSCTWGAGYAVVFHSGDLLGAASSNPLPGSIAPGETVDIFLPMQAPSGGGVYYSNWELQNAEGQRFGTGSAAADKFWTRIQVNWVPQGGSGGEAATGDPGTGGGETVSSGSCEYTTDPVFVQTVITLINQARANNGLPALSENSALDTAAQTHSIDMACNNHSSHTGSDGSSWPQRIAAQGYAAGLALENVYAGDPAFGGTPQGAVNWWLNSETHLANILNPQVTEIGVGYAASPQATYIGRLTAVFARP